MLAAAVSILTVLAFAVAAHLGTETAASANDDSPALMLVLPATVDRGDLDLVDHKRELAGPPAGQSTGTHDQAVRRMPRAENVAASRSTRPAQSVDAVVSFALAQVGKPYKWAKAGPGSYDCSGLVMAAFARIGVKLPHQTGGIIRYGKAVSRSQLQRGDVVFPAKGHVGIYLGGGMFVHAPYPGDHVKGSKLYAFYAGRRI
jgi:cell wall-associated NlpC family hydrolase